MFIQAKGTDFEKVLHWNHFDVFNTKTDVDLVKILGFSANPSDNNYWKSSKSYDVIDFSRLLELMRDQFIREIPYSYSPISITQCFRSPKEVELLIPIGFSSDENVIVAITRPNNWPPIDNHHNESGTRLITIDLTTRKVNTLFDGRKTWDEIYLPVSSQNKNTVSGFVLETLSGADGKWKRMYSLKIWDITSGQEIDAIHQVCYD
jgi:transposase